jgi:hydroxypyruvate reductase
MSARRILLELFDAALRAVGGRSCTARHLRDAKLPARIAVFAVGKAASAMALGARDTLGEAIESMLVLTKVGHCDPELTRAPRVLQLESAHPVPDDSSLAAGAELESRLAKLPPDVLPIFLISGGSSSLVEALRDGVSLADLQALNERGLAAGWNIAALNAERSRLSRIKGGGIARALGKRRALALFISDVPGDDPDVIGSGLLGRDAAHADRVERHVVANLEGAVRAVMDAADARGLNFESLEGRFEGDAGKVAEQFLARLRTCTGDGLVWGGESTVRLPVRHGRGGRNTHVALNFARQLRTGTDGPTDDAGAIVDAGTVVRATIAGCDVELAAREFDSGTALEAAEDLVHTGPTGTNVGDILIAIKQSATSLRDDGSSRML